jgi:hypothetical protein
MRGVRYALTRWGVRSSPRHIASAQARRTCSGRRREDCTRRRASVERITSASIAYKTVGPVRRVAQAPASKPHDRRCSVAGSGSQNEVDAHASCVSSELATGLSAWRAALPLIHAQAHALPDFLPAPRQTACATCSPGQRRVRTPRCVPIGAHATQPAGVAVSIEQGEGRAGGHASSTGRSIRLCTMGHRADAAHAAATSMWTQPAATLPSRSAPAPVSVDRWHRQPGTWCSLACVDGRARVF